MEAHQMVKIAGFKELSFTLEGISQDNLEYWIPRKLI